MEVHMIRNEWNWMWFYFLFDVIFNAMILFFVLRQEMPNMNTTEETTTEQKTKQHNPSKRVAIKSVKFTYMST